jgi:hypothetical protein
MPNDRQYHIAGFRVICEYKCIREEEYGVAAFNSYAFEEYV